ncbi:hypothetical protein ACFLY0_01510 [Patescibacteria group bacterium]
MNKKYSKNNYKGGQVMILSVTFFMFASLAILTGLIFPVIKDAERAREMAYSTESFFIAEAGTEDALYRLIEGMIISVYEQLGTGTATTTMTITTVGSNEKTILSEGNVFGRYRSVESSVSVDSGVSFSFGVQAGDGGFIIENSASIQGNAYSNGPIIGGNSNLIAGDVISAGPGGIIDGIYTTASAYANTITNSEIDVDAFYDSISFSTVFGTEYPDSVDLPIVDMPIADSLIETWKSDAEAGGVTSSPCPYAINDDITLGPVKIACDLEITGSPTITLSGPVWVEGDIDIANSAVIQADLALGSNSVVMIADNPADNLNSGTIKVQNTVTFNGTGETGSYVMLVSQNESAEQGGTNEAIEIKNSVSGDLLIYAGHGEVELENSVNLKEVAGYKINLQNTAEVVYETGLASLLFSSEPSGSWVVKDWKEVE